MVMSSACANRKDVETAEGRERLVKRGDNLFDSGGYFILNGQYYVMQSQNCRAPNKPFCTTSSDQVVCEMKTYMDADHTTPMEKRVITVAVLLLKEELDCKKKTEGPSTFNLHIRSHMKDTLVLSGPYEKLPLLGAMLAYKELKTLTECVDLIKYFVKRDDAYSVDLCPDNILDAILSESVESANVWEMHSCEAARSVIEKMKYTGWDSHFKRRTKHAQEGDGGSYRAQPDVEKCFPNFKNEILHNVSSFTSSRERRCEYKLDEEVRDAEAADATAPTSETSERLNALVGQARAKNAQTVILLAQMAACCILLDSGCTYPSIPHDPSTSVVVDPGSLMNGVLKAQLQKLSASVRNTVKRHVKKANDTAATAAKKSVAAVVEEQQRKGTPPLWANDIGSKIEKVVSASAIEERNFNAIQSVIISGVWTNKNKQGQRWTYFSDPRSKEKTYVMHPVLDDKGNSDKRLSYPKGQVHGHIHRVNKNMVSSSEPIYSADEAVSSRPSEDRLISRSQGYICPCSTPDSEKVGWIDQFAITATVSQSLSTVDRATVFSAIRSIDSFTGIDEIGAACDILVTPIQLVWIDGDAKGVFVGSADVFLSSVLDIRMTSYAFRHVTAWKCNGDIYIATYPGRLVRPLINLRRFLRMTDGLMSNKTVADVSKNLDTVFTKHSGLTAEPGIPNFGQMVGFGLIDFVDCDMERTDSVGADLADSIEERDGTVHVLKTRVEIHGITMFGRAAVAVPWINMAPTTRAVMWSKMFFQADAPTESCENKVTLGEGSRQSPVYDTRSIVSTICVDAEAELCEELGYGPNNLLGANATVSLEGSSCNQEDAVSMARASADRGLCMSLKQDSTQSWVKSNRDNPGCDAEEFSNFALSSRQLQGINVYSDFEATETSRDRSCFDILKLGWTAKERGRLDVSIFDFKTNSHPCVVRIGARVKHNDVLIAKRKKLVNGSADKKRIHNETGESKNYIDTSVSFKPDDPRTVGKVTDVSIERADFGSDESIITITVVVQYMNSSVDGQKETTRHGQKGIVAGRRDPWELAFGADGVPLSDFQKNPTGQSGRLTINEMLCTQVAMYGVELGERVDGTAFTSKPQATLKSLQERVALRGARDPRVSPSGKAIVCDPVSGEVRPNPTAVGIDNIHKLYHIPERKAQARGVLGEPRDVLTGQPTKGKKEDGGLRFGEMERDGALAHSVPHFVADRLGEASDLKGPGIGVCPTHKEICSEVYCSREKEMIWKCPRWQSPMVAGTAWKTVDAEYDWLPAPDDLLKRTMSRSDYGNLLSKIPPAVTLELDISGTAVYKVARSGRKLESTGPTILMALYTVGDETEWLPETPTGSDLPRGITVVDAEYVDNDGKRLSRQSSSSCAGDPIRVKMPGFIGALEHKLRTTGHCLKICYDKIGE